VVKRRKGAWWMPWRREAMKDVVGCDKPRGAVKHALILGFPNGETRRRQTSVIPQGKRTRGTDTSKYPQERKSKETPPVAASEKGSAQTGASAPGLRVSAMSRKRQLKQLESCSIESERLVGESVTCSMTFQSSTGLVEPGVKPGGPPPKAKYSSTTDSEPVRRLNGEKHRF